VARPCEAGNDTLAAVSGRPAVVTAERFARGMTFDEYVAYAGTPENLAREAGWLSALHERLVVGPTS